MKLLFYSLFDGFLIDRFTTKHFVQGPCPVPEFLQYLYFATFFLQCERLRGFVLEPTRIGYLRKKLF